jgi:hypothetical protein
VRNQRSATITSQIPGNIFQHILSPQVRQAIDHHATQYAERGLRGTPMIFCYPWSDWIAIAGRRHRDGVAQETYRGIEGQVAMAPPSR